MEKYKCVIHTFSGVLLYLPVPIIEITTAALKTKFANELFILLFLVAEYFPLNWR